MNNSRFTTAIKQLQSIRMNPEEKSALHASILSKIQNKQAGGAAEPFVIGEAAQPVLSPWSIQSFREWGSKHRIASIVVIVLAVATLDGARAFITHGTLDESAPREIQALAAPATTAGIKSVKTIIKETGAAVTAVSSVPTADAATTSKATSVHSPSKAR
ncbi:MAG: hypothetical protein JWO00_604 [Candidatus Parcubacteria bacterium]|nr:hypothetical protein [Candidatus Parcubacteria bacterium]